jgi:hypothetical protein
LYIAGTPSDDAAAGLALQDLLSIDAVQAAAMLDMQWGRLTEANVSGVLADATERRREVAACLTSARKARTGYVFNDSSSRPGQAEGQVLGGMLGRATSRFRCVRIYA